MINKEELKKMKKNCQTKISCEICTYFNRCKNISKDGISDWPALWTDKDIDIVMAKLNDD